MFTFSNFRNLGLYDLKTFSLQKSSTANEKDLLKYDTIMRALHLQGQADIEGVGEEEELPPLLCGVVTGKKLSKLIIFEKTEEGKRFVITLV